MPKSLLYRLLRTGQVRINGKRAKPQNRIHEGDKVRIPPVKLAVRGKDHKISQQKIALIEKAIIFEDAYFIAIDKPSGLASHGGSGISHGAIELLRAARPEEKIDLVHRLDKDTSGILVFARKRKALLALQALIREGNVIKQYMSLLAGKVDKPKFDVNVPLRKFAMQGGERMVKVASDGKPALTFFKQLEAYAHASLMRVDLSTGRTHQIRVHAAYAGFPVAGDPKYGERDVNKQFKQQQGLQRLFLHASRFEFDWGENAYSFSAPLPDDLHKVLDKLPLA